MFGGGVVGCLVVFHSYYSCENFFICSWEVIRAAFHLFLHKQRLAEEQAREDEETLNNVPDNFLDPIMGHLMVRPVRLPSSGVVLDRTTIARHLLRWVVEGWIDRDR